MSWLHFIALGVVAFLVTLLTTPAVKRFAVGHDVVDHPGGRRVNTEPIPRLGGVAILFGIAVALLVQMLGERIFGWGGPFYTLGEFNWKYVGVAFGVLITFITGLIDDFISLSPGVKFGGQILAALVIVASGVAIDFIANPFEPGLVSLGYASVPITVIYLVAFSNVINLIDGLDGLAAGIVVIATMSLMLLALDGNQFDAATLSVVLIASCLAFLRYNFNPASIFMGDSGSLTIGFLVGVISLLGVTRSTATIALAIPIIIVGIPVIDTFSAIVRRLRAHKPIQSADKGHIHHRLLRKGYGQRKTVIIIYLWSVLLSVGGYLVATMSSLVRLITFIVLAIVSFLIMWRLGLWNMAVEPHAKRGRDSGMVDKPGGGLTGDVQEGDAPSRDDGVLDGTTRDDGTR